VSYRPRRVARAATLELRGIAHRILRFGPRDARPCVFLHGWADTAATFQFLIDAFEDDHPIVALDWRGFGESAWLGTPYWFPDYYADLEALLGEVHPDGPATLLGHSMGGNIAALYAGIRPERVRAVINLEGFGLRRTAAEAAPKRLRRWLDELRTPPAFSRFRTLEDFAAVLRRKNPRLTAERAAFVALNWSRPEPDGGYSVNFDPYHRLVNPALYRREEAEACWRGCVAPMLMVFGGLSEFRAQLGGDASEETFRALFRDIRFATLPDSGHMMHHDEPEALARIVEPWLRSPPAP
jgi:pimeloyl-ACP methyl ester carboxylesterase